MTYLRWIHKSWSFFWNFIGVLVVTVLLIGGIGFGVLQLQPVKDQIASRIIEGFNEQYQGVLSIGELDGLLPVEIVLRDVRLYSDSAEYEPVIQAEEVRADLNIRSFLSKNYEVQALSIVKPEAIIDQGKERSLASIFQKRNPAETDTSAFAPDIQLLAPQVLIQDGRVLIRNAGSYALKKPETDSITIRNINLDMFLEYTNEQRFLDINQVSFNSPELQLDNVEIYGQVYNDNQFLEFNAFNVRAGDSGIRFSAEADRVNLLNPDIWKQIQASGLEMNVNELFIEPRFFQALYPEAPELKKTLYASANGEGTLDSLWFNKLELSMGESVMDSYGYVTHLDSIQNLGYGLTLENLNLTEDEVELYSRTLNPDQLDAITNTRVEGEVTGTLDWIRGNVTLLGDRGSLQLDGNVRFAGEESYQLNIQADSLNLGNLLAETIKSTNLNLSGTVSGNRLSFENGSGQASLEAGNGSVDSRNFEAFNLLGEWENGYITPEFDLTVDSSTLSGDGYIDLRNQLSEISMTGSANKLRINELLNIEGLRPSLLDLEYEVLLKGNTFSDLHGQVSLDIPHAYVGQDTLGRHQFYLDFNAPDAPTRSLRLTSTALDATIEGDYNPSDLLALSKHWKTYFEERIKEEILFNDSLEITSSQLNIEDQSLTLTGRFKNPSLLKAYYPAFPSIETSARINSSLDISPERILFNGSVSDQRFRYNDYEIDTLLAQITGSFRYQNKLKEYGSLQVQASSEKFRKGAMSGTDFDFYTELNRDSLFVNTDIDQVGDNAYFMMESSGMLQDSSLAFRITDFNLGTGDYEWENNGEPAFRYGINQKLILDNFSFESGSQYVELQGIYSPDPADSVRYIIRDLNLSRISGLLSGRIDFGGLLNGIFTTRTLTKVPTIQGDINVKGFTLNNNMVGDLTLNSTYNQPLNRFDTQIQVTTDSTKYPGYYANNERGGQEFDINGYIRAPDDGEFPQADSLYAFDLDFENIDMWILPLIGPKVFAEASGKSSGEGKLWGNLDTYDFEVDFMVGVNDAVYFQPKFLDTYYYAQGAITFSRDQGLQFDDVYLIDPSGGNAILSGYFDFNDFQPESFMDLRVEMNDFQFLNSDFDPTVPFFGTAYGTSVVTIRGSNFSPVLTTETPLNISDFSRIGIPLLEETEFNEDNKFIRFVNSFDLSEKGEGEEGSEGYDLPDNQNREDLTFAERFTLDLQFEANNPMTVDLIFDPVTGDQITANGTGRLRIRLEDQEVSMFGRFDITDGRYQFVSGDIFTRRFDLEPGGYIVWEGSPGNARLNLSAVYRARPDIYSLIPPPEGESEETVSRERVPVELVLNITGTLNSIENEFFFRLPNTFQSRQNSLFATQLNALNRNEDEKLIQATSFLLMDNFIRVSSSSGTAQTNSLGQNISGSGAVLNPLLSNQVISPLLSNQINSLLNSDLSSFDVDFNLNTYNQVDLGVALRLYNDKLILRREGQITGRQSNIGDLGATYRINRIFSVTAFHRQDPTLDPIGTSGQSQQFQDINGVGVEATFSFNTWKEFFNRITSPFRKLLGIKENDEEITENTEGNTPSQGNK